MKILAILLLFVPAAIAAEFFHASPVVVFALSALAIVPLSGYLGKATEEIAAYTGPSPKPLIRSASTASPPLSGTAVVTANAVPASSIT